MDIKPDDYWVEIVSVRVKIETAKAFKVELVDDNTIEFWLPKSQFREMILQEEGDVGEPVLPRWLVREKENELRDFGFDVSLTEEDFEVPERGSGYVAPEDDDDIPF